MQVIENKYLIKFSLKEKKGSCKKFAEIVYKNKIFHKSLQRIFCVSILIIIFLIPSRKKMEFVFFLKVVYVYVRINFIDYTNEMLLFVEGHTSEKKKIRIRIIVRISNYLFPKHSLLKRLR